MMRAGMVAVLLLGAGEAQAARHELTIQYEGAAHGDDALDRTIDAEGFDGFGLTAGYAVLRGKDAAELYRNKRFGLVVGLGWARAERSTWTSTERSGWDTRFVTDEVRLGAKVDVDIANVVYPFLRVEAGLLVGTSTLTADGSWDEGRAPIRGVGLAPEGVFTAGFEILVPDRKLGWPVTMAWTFEAGGRVAGPLALGEMGGAFDLSGGVFRAGMGLRY